MSLLSKIATMSFLRGLAVLLVVLLLMGMVVWSLERRKKPEEYGGSPVKGIAHGVFWAFESLVGKAGSLSQSRTARVVALLWTFTITLLISGVTAKLSAELTVNQLATTVKGPDDLPKVRVGTASVEGFVTPAQRWLSARGIRYKVCGKDAAECLAALARRDVDAIVDEAPVISYQAAKQYPDRLIVLPGTFENHGYAFGYPIGSTVRRKLDIATLELVESPEWKDILSRYDVDR